MALLLSAGAQTQPSATAIAVDKAPQARSEKKLSFPKKPLKLLGTFSLRDDMPAAKAPVHDVVWFGFDDKGRIGLLRFAGGADYSFALMDQEGRLIHEQLLLKQTGPLMAADLKCSWVTGDRWVIVACGIGTEEKTAAWWLDGASGKLEPIMGFTCPTVRNLVGSEDGGFIALAVTTLSFTPEEEVIAFDNTGRMRWRIGEASQTQKVHGRFHPGGIAVTSRGQLAVLDKTQAKVQLFEMDGRFAGTVDLEQAWGRKPNYPEEISAGQSGGMLIRDLHGVSSVVLMDSSGKVVSQHDLKYQDGRVIDPVRGVKLSPSGRVWACDEAGLARVNQEGVADLVLGPAQDTGRLGEIAALAVNQRGLLGAVDAGTGAAHLFDKNGKRVGVCKPDPGDFLESLAQAHVAISESGDVFLSDGEASHGTAKYIHFGADGRRIGVQQFALDDISRQCYSLPTEGCFLVVGYHGALIVGREGNVLKKIEKRPDNNGLGSVLGGSVATDGSFAIASHEAGRTGGFAVSVYSPEGEPIRTIAMPANCVPSCFAFTGKYLASCTETEICLFNALGEPVLAFKYPLEHFKDHWWICLATESGRELWMVSPGLKKVVRFELPE